MPDVEPGPDARPDRIRRIVLRSLLVLGAVAGVWLLWTGVSVWLSFRSIDRIGVDVDAARSALEAIQDADRPQAPPVEIIPEPGDGAAVPTTAPVSPDPGASESTTTTTATPEPPGPEILPYDPSFAASPAIPNDAFDAFLIIGSDARAGLGGSRADVILLALLPSDGSNPILVSLPRDLWLPNSCWERSRRINASLNGCGDAATGPELLAVTVAEFTGIQPDHFALFDFEDFQRVIDAFGGLDVCVDRPVRFRGNELDAGCTRVDGATALEWVRSRSTREFRDGEWRPMRGVNDLTRNARQRDVLLQLLARVRSMNTITSLADIVGSIADAVTIDEALSAGDIVSLAWSMRRFAPRDIVQVTIPVANYRTSGGAAVLIPTEPFSVTFADHWPR